MNLLILNGFLSILCLSCVISGPCDISDGQMKSARIEFKQDLIPNSELFTVPFMGDKTQISNISLVSNEMKNEILYDYFKIDFKTLSLKKYYDLNTLKIDFLEILFICTSALTPHSNTFLLYVTISDVNMYEPEFINEPYQISLNETTPVGSKIFKFKVIDKDLPNKPNSQLSFSILNGPCSNYFEFVLSTKSELSLKKKLNFDVFNECILTIRASDYGSPPKSSTATINIEILDVDNKDPKFTRNVYNGILKHNSAPETYVNMNSNDIEAADQDFGLNTPLVYSITSNPGEFFDIDSNNGKIKLKKKLPIDYKEEYDLIIKSCQIDDSAKCALAMVNITVITINENEPKFDQEKYEFEVAENAPFYTIISTVHATDLDDNQINYFMDYSEDNPFVIDSKTGSIRVNRKLDYEAQTSHKIEVEANDGLHSTKVNVIINVLNIVDKAPYFDQVSYSFIIHEPYQDYIGEVKAIDEEKTDQLLYNLEFKEENETEVICIHSDSGLLYFCPNQTNNYFDTVEFNFKVVASIPTNDSKNEIISSQVNVSLKIDRDAKNASLKPLTNRFTDQDSFVAYMSALGGIMIILFASIMIIFWIKQSNDDNKVPSVINASSILTYRSTSSNSTFKKSSGSSQYPIITQWNNKNLNRMFYSSTSEPTEYLNSKSVSSFSSKSSKKHSKSSSPPISTHSSNVLNSTSSTITSLQNTSFGMSSGESINIDFPIPEENNEPLSINYETNLNEIIIQEDGNLHSFNVDSGDTTTVSNDISEQMKIQVNDSETPRLIEYQAQNYYKEYYRQYDFNSSSSGQIAYV